MNTPPSDPSPDRRHSRRTLFLIGVAAALVLMTEAGALTGFLRPAPASLPSTPPPPYDAWRAQMRLHAPPPPEAPPPRTWPAADAVLPDNAQVIGVELGGRHRAYLVNVLGVGPASHIVNDLVGGLPLSVSYCNLHDCVQVVTDKGAAPLKLQVTGVDGWSMLLAVGGHNYRQSTLEPLEADTPAFPYRIHPWERTTWGAWKSAHPDTDVYLGRDDATAQGQTG